MPVDASIYGMLRGPAAMPDPVEQYGKALTLRTMMGQQSLQGLQEDELRRSIGEKGKLRDLFARNPKPTDAEIAAIDPEAMLKYRKSALENTELQGRINKTEGEVINQRLAFFRDRIPGDPQGAAQWLSAQYSDPVLAPHLMKAGPLETALAQIPTDPQAFTQWRTAEALGMKAFMEKNVPNVSTRNLGGTTETISVAPLTGEMRTLGTSTNTQSPDSAASITASARQGELNRGVTVRGQNMTDARAAQTAGVPAGYRRLSNGNLEPIPGGPAEKDNAPEAMLKAAGYADRMRKSSALLDKFKKDGKPELLEVTAGGTPLVGTIAANVARSPERQQFHQAAEDWVRAKLRQESGAVIADEEMAREIRTYFPMIGDSAAVVKQKEGARKTAEQAMVTAAGRAIKAGAADTTPQETKTIGGKNYVKINGQWFEQ